MPDGDHAELEISCSKGTYVRSLARDLALALGTLGHVSALRRVAHGTLREAPALPLDKLLGFSHIPPLSAALEAHLLPLENPLAHNPRLAMRRDTGAPSRRGQGIYNR